MTAVRAVEEVIGLDLVEDAVAGVAIVVSLVEQEESGAARPGRVAPVRDAGVRVRRSMRPR